MYWAASDCGTTNSRVYLLGSTLRILRKGSRKVGVRDTALSGSRAVLREGLARLVASGRPTRRSGDAC